MPGSGTTLNSTKLMSCGSDRLERFQFFCSRFLLFVCRGRNKSEQRRNKSGILPFEAF